MLDAADRSPKDPPTAPGWVLNYAPLLARLWGDGLTKAHRLAVNQTVLAWSRSDPDGLLAAARVIASQDGTLQLRYLQTLADVGVEKNTTIILTDIAGLLTKLPGALGPVLARAAVTGNGGDAKALARPE